MLFVYLWKRSWECFCCKKLVKLAWLAIRQVSEPIARLIKDEARRNPFFRNNICMPPAQVYHWVEVNMKMWGVNLGRPVQVPPLDEATAIDLGAKVLGELFIFAVGALALLYEHIRQLKKEARREKNLELEKVELRNRVAELNFRVEQKKAQLSEISGILVELVLKPKGINSFEGLEAVQTEYKKQDNKLKKK
ncbi:putative OPA3-like protein CG13603 isoform 1-T1 [Glossina fuscipes fuscipes]